MMTADAKNERIALLCGWKWWKTCPPFSDEHAVRFLSKTGWFNDGCRQGEPCVEGDESLRIWQGWTGEKAPDYVRDLNAMHEAVLSRHDDSSLYTNYHRILESICRTQNSQTGPAEFIYSSETTAEQRANAFLLAFGVGI